MTLQELNILMCLLQKRRISQRLSNLAKITEEGCGSITLRPEVSRILLLCSNPKTILSFLKALLLHSSMQRLRWKQNQKAKTNSARL